MATGRSIEEILRGKLERSRTAYEAETANFQKVIEDVPSGIPYLDSTTRIRNAAESHNRTLAEYQSALERFNDFVIRRIIPDDLKSSD